jgi:succinyl-diaminopimelate desuccinylase
MSDLSGTISEELARTTLELCSIPSETGREERIADHVEGLCRAQLGSEAVRRIGNSVVCEPPRAAGSHDRPTVALVGHLDTVRCAEQQPTEIREGRVYGCGASDMKAGVAVMIALLDRWRQLESAHPVWIFYDKEEGPHQENGLEPVLASGALPRLDLALVLEPTDRALQMGCMGTLHATVVVRGRRAHSARPWQGDNAIYLAIPVLQRLAELERREVAFGDLAFYEVMVATRAWTENSANVVPDRVMFNVNARFAPGRTGDQALQELRELVGKDGDVILTDVAPSGDVYLGHPLLEPWRVRRGLDVAPKQAWTDVARFTQRRIPAVNFGPGETAQAHQAGEWCSIDSLEHCFTNLVDFFTAPIAPHPAS